MEWREAAERQHGLVTKSQMGQATVHAELRRGGLEVAARGVYRVSGSVPTWRQRLLAAVLAAGVGAAASGFAAAALWRIPGFPEGPIEVTRQSRAGRTSRRSTLHAVRRLPPRLLTEQDGIPVTTPELTLLDLCGVVHPLRAERAVDSALAARLVTVGRLEVALADVGRRGRNGTAVFREIVTGRSGAYVPPASELEAVFVSLVDQAGLVQPERQVVLGDERGPAGRVDFVYRAERVVIEVDGRRWHSADLDREADARRQARLQAAGWTVLRFTWRQLTKEPDLVISVLARVLAAGGANTRQFAG